MMYREKMYLKIGLLIAALCVFCAVYAQGVAAPPAPAPAAKPAAPAAAAPDAAQDKPVVKNLELRSGARGMILIISGPNPLPFAGKSADFEKTTAKYKDFTVNIPGAGYALGAAATFNPPPELPISSIALKTVASGLSITVKMKGIVEGPIDVRSSENQMRILLTRSAYPEIVWSSEKGLISGSSSSAAPAAVAAPAPAAPKAAPAAASAPATAPVAPKVASKAETPPVFEPEPNIAPSGEVTKKTPEGELVKYKIFGRDPFVPLVRDTTTTELPSVENLRLVGVLEDARERIALLEDFKNGNRAFALRTNDAVAQGKVLRVHRDKVVFLIRDFDVSHTYTLGLSLTNTNNR